MPSPGVLKEINTLLNPLQNVTYNTTLDQATLSYKQQWKYFYSLWVLGSFDGSRRYALMKGLGIFFLLILTPWGFSDYASLGILRLVGIVINILVWPVALAIIVLSLIPVAVFLFPVMLFWKQMSTPFKFLFGIVAAIALVILGIPGIIVAVSAFAVAAITTVLFLIAKMVLSAIGATVTFPFKLFYDALSNWRAQPYLDDLLAVRKTDGGITISTDNYWLPTGLNYSRNEEGGALEFPISQYKAKENRHVYFVLTLLLTSSLNAVEKDKICKALTAVMVLNPKIEAQIAEFFENDQLIASKDVDSYEEEVDLSTHDKKVKIPFTRDSFFNALGLKGDAGEQQQVVIQDFEITAR